MTDKIRDEKINEKEENNLNINGEMENIHEEEDIKSNEENIDILDFLRGNHEESKEDEKCDETFDIEEDVDILDFLRGDCEEEKEDEKEEDENIDIEEDAKEDNKNKNSLIKTCCIVGLVSSIVGSGLTMCVMKNSLSNNVSAPIVVQEGKVKGSGDLNIYQAVSKKVSPSVVGILTKSVAMNNIFSIPVENSGLGTGVIVDSRGYILTNAHVVDTQGKGEINVVLSDGKNMPGNVLWKDTALDLAVIKIDGTNYISAELGDSDTALVGDIAIAIGNPLGIEFQATVTQGIISGVNRTVEASNFSMEGLLQTDASINPGNSGGPLLNDKGQVIGINTAKTSNAEGIGFAIPINIAKPIVEQVIKTGSYNKVLLGIKGMALKSFESLLGVDLTAEKGIYVVEVQEKSAANMAGIKTGDIIVGIGNQEVSDMNGLTKELYKFKEGDSCELTVNRSGENVKLKVKF